MMLPLPTVSNIDVTAERLKDVERDAARPLPDLAGGATKALQVGAAAVEMGEQDKARQEAQWFQKEYIDKGWEGMQKLWQETGSDPAMNPAYWRTAVGDSPAKYAEALGKKVEAKEEKTKWEEYAKTLDADDPESAKAVRLGLGKEVYGKRMDAQKTRETQQAITDRNAANIASRERLGNARNQISRDRLDIQKAMKGATAEEISAYKEFESNLDSLDAEIQSLYDAYGQSGYEASDRDKKKLEDALRRRSDVSRNINILIRKGAKSGDGGGDGGDGGGGKGKIDAATAKSYLEKSGGDKAKAREMAKADGWEF